MDYSDIDEHSPEVEFRFYSQEEIEAFIKSIASAYPSLLQGEEVIWKSIEDLIDFLK